MLQITIRSFSAAVFRYENLAAQTLFKKPGAGDVIGMCVGLEAVEKLEPQLLDERRVAAYLVEDRIDEYRLAALIIAK